MAESLGLVTVVVSVYNIEALLPRCLDCISAQTYRDLEILLIDDGSTDGSGRLCDAFAATDPRARVIHQENRGLWAVRNRGLAEAKGEYLVFPDGDDYFHKDYIFWLVQAINWGGKKYPMAICDHIQTMTGREDTTSDSTPSFEVLDQSFLLDRIICFPDCMYAEWGANWNKIYRKSILPDSFQKPYPRCQDFDSNLRVFFLTEQAVYVHKVLYYWFQWPGRMQMSYFPGSLPLCASPVFGVPVRVVGQCLQEADYLEGKCPWDSRGAGRHPEDLGNRKTDLPFFLRQQALSLLS